MKTYFDMSIDERRAELDVLWARYESEKKAGHKLDMSRGKPDPTQLNLSMDMLQQNPYDLIYTRKAPTSATTASWPAWTRPRSFLPSCWV